MSEALREEGKRQADAQEELALHYKQLADSDVMEDLLRELTDQYESAHAIAIVQTDPLNDSGDLARGAAALQQANAYDKIKTYILSMMV